LRPWRAILRRMNVICVWSGRFCGRIIAEIGAELGDDHAGDDHFGDRVPVETVRAP
jgi:hypothetical protein